MRAQPAITLELQPTPDAGRVLILAPNGSYRTAPFINAAQQLQTRVTLASHGQSAVSTATVEGINVDFSAPDRVLATLSAEHARQPFCAVLATDDTTTEIAARVAQALGLPHNEATAVRIARRKDHARARLHEHGVRAPAFRRIDLTQSLDTQAAQVNYPCVLKPVAMSASRGVIRANNSVEFIAACTRIAKILRRDASSDDERHTVLAEDFIAGGEVAVEGLLSQSTLTLLALFDKPDPLDGPFFEETYYVTPSRLALTVQDDIRGTVEAACRAYGLREGPIHAECRINEHGAWILEVAPRTIGGLCGRLLRFGTGMSLEELVLAHALGRPIDTRLADHAGGVLMIPVPTHGILRRVEGTLAAQKIDYIEEVTIQMREGVELVPWPEGSSYLGFIFARAPTPELAENALRRAHACLRVVAAPLWRGTLENTST